MVKNLIPKSIKTKLQPLYEKRISKKLMDFDANRFLKYGFGLKDNTDSLEQLEGRITKAYHSLEKGFSYQNFRYGFGRGVLIELIELLELYNEKNYPQDRHSYQTALSNLYQYIKFHEDDGHDVKDLKKKVNELGQTESASGGVIWLNKDRIFEESQSDFKAFSNSRHSIRDYSEEPVKLELIEQAINLASNTPSACNRQPWKVRIVQDENLKKTIQKNQNGNRGFGDYIDQFLIITSDIQYYARNRERNQADIDGGMYAMNLLYSLHYYKIATVPLSASLGLKQEENLREAFNIEDSENFVMFIGVGNYVDNFKVPISSKRPPKFEVF